MLAALLGSGDPLVTLIAPLAGLLLLAILLGYVGELRRRTPTPTAESDERKPWSFAKLTLVMLLLLLVGRAFLMWFSADAELADVHEGRRAAGVACLGFAALVLGTWWPRVVGWAVGRLALGLALTGGAWLTLLAAQDRLGPGEGLLGNTGYDLQVLLPGAVFGLFTFGTADRMTRPSAVLGGLAFLLTAWFAVLAPVVGGLLVLGAFGLVSLIRSRARGRVAALLLAGLVGAPLVLLGSGDAAPAEGAPEVTTTAEHLGGVGVRLAIWESVLFPRPDLGVGQFQREYPPLRDPAELAASTGGQTLAQVTEVEHPHSDLVLAWAEGSIGGAIGLAGLVLGLLAVGGSVLLLGRCVGSGHLALAAAALALPVAGLFHTPLLVNPLAALLGWSLLGALLWRTERWRDEEQQTDVPQDLATALALDLECPGRRGSTALRLSLPGVALLLVGPAFDWSPLGLDDLGAVAPPELASLHDARDAVLAGRLPFEVVALHARSLEARDPDQAALFWDLALELRPHAVEALIQRGKLFALEGDLDRADEHWTYASELYPGYPPLGTNLRLLGADLVLAGELERGLGHLQPVLGDLDVDPDQAREPAVLLQVARLLEAPGRGAPSLERAALAAAAHRLQAWRLGEAGAFAEARTSIARAAGAREREWAGRPPMALVLAGNEVPANAAVPTSTPPVLLLELAACEAAEGRLDTARARLADPSISRPAVGDESPDWVRRTIALLGRADGEL